MIPPSQNKGMDYKEYTEAKRGTSWKQKLKQTIDRLVITAKDYGGLFGCRCGGRGTGVGFQVCPE